jgi:hypothetical protein
MGDGFFWVIRPSGCVDVEEGGRLTTSNVVGPWDVDHEADDVANVEVMHSVGVNGDVDNQLRSFGERGVVIEERSLWNKMLVGGKKLVGVPIVVVQDCICKVANCLQDDTPLRQAGLPAKAQSEHHQQDVNLDKLCASLHGCRRIEMTSSVGGLEIYLGCQDRDVGEKLTGGDGLIDNPLDACTEHARKELFSFDAAAGRGSRRLLETLVVSLTVFGDNPPVFIDGVLLLDVHWSDENIGDFLGLREGEGEAVAKMHVL